MRDLTKWKFTLEYDGSGFCGWQSQPNGKGVQDAIETAITRIDYNHKRVSVAGRTDAGVHALGQVCSVALEKDWEEWRLIEALNANLRELGKVSILSAEKMPDNFDARFSAKGRRYLYIVQNRRAPLAHFKGLVWRVPYELNIDGMREGASALLGTHDFTTFRDTQCQAKSPIKTLDKFDVFEVETPFGTQIHFELAAISFLHRQVRSMVGTLIDVGRGRFDIDELKRRLEAKSRNECGEVAPPDGLYLTGVEY